MKYLLVNIVCVLYFLFPVQSSASVRINEVMQGNVGFVLDDDNEFPDSWVEIYNADSVAIDFTDFSLGLSKDFQTSYPISAPTAIPANGYFILYCDKKNGGRHADFRLDVEGCNLYLFSQKGDVVDSLAVPAMLAPGVAYGRVGDGADSLGYFRNATPERENPVRCFNRFMKKPKFSVAGGVYDGPITVRISPQADCPADAVVRYTTNGSEPTEFSPVAPDSILVERTTVVRAKVFSDSALGKESKTHSYIIQDREYTLPIVSIVTDSAYFYDDEIGILVEGTYGDTHPDKESDIPDYGNMNFLFSWNRPANVEYFDIRKSRTAVVNQLCEVEIGGNTSSMMPVKSLNVKAKKKFGENKFSYAFWDDKPEVKKSKCFYLRNAGQDYLQLHLRDAMQQMSFGQHVNLDWQACQPAVVLINGRYYGMLNLREKANADFIWSNHNKLENIDLLVENAWSAKEGDLVEYKKFKKRLRRDGLTLAELEAAVDLDEFLNYTALNVFYCNKDWPGNNQMVWRERSVGAKWRYIAKDMDITSGEPFFAPQPSDPYFNYLLRMPPFIEGINVSEESHSAFVASMRFPEVRNQMVDRLSVYMATFISAEECAFRIDSLAALLAPEIPYYYDLIGREEGVFPVYVNMYKDWINYRVPFLYKHMQSFFELGDTVSLTVKSRKGLPLFFNNVKVEKGEFNGRYYYGRPFYLSRSNGVFAYQGDSLLIDKADSLRTDGCWYVSWEEEGRKRFRKVERSSFFFSIPKGARKVLITDSIDVDTAGCGSPLLFALKQNSCGLPFAEAEIVCPTLTDCLGNESQAFLEVSADTLPLGSSSLDWCFVTAFGDTLRCPQKVEVVDGLAPVIDCNDLMPLSLFLAEDECMMKAETVLENAPSALDNCNIMLSGRLESDAPEYGLGEHQLLWTFTDEAGNVASCPQMLAVVDTVRPVFDSCYSMPEVRTIIADDRCALSFSEVPLTAPVAKDNCTEITGITDEDLQFQTGENFVVWLFEDLSGNRSQCAQRVVVDDRFAPVLPDCDDMPILEYELTDNSCGVLVGSLDITVPLAQDNCGVLIAGILHSEPVMDIGANQLLWTFVDAAGNETHCSQLLDVKDRCAPVLGDCERLPELTYNITDAACDVNAKQLPIVQLEAEDNCGVMVAGRIVANQERYEIGEHDLRWLFADAYGNELECAQKLHVNDRFAPYADCKALSQVVFSLPVNTDIVASSEVMLNVPLAVDNCGAVVCGSLLKPDAYVYGDNIVAWRFADVHGNESYCNQMVHMDRNYVLDLWPNPVQDFLQIDGAEPGIPFVIYNALGGVVIKSETTGNPTIVDTKNWAAGIFVVHIADKVYKVVKK